MNNYPHSGCKSLRSIIRTAACLWIIISFQQLSAAADAPANVDNGVRELLNADPAMSVAAAARKGGADGSGVVRKAVRDKQNRVMLNIHLNGKVSLQEVRNALVASGANVTAETNLYRHGAISAFVPIDKIAEVARRSGVLSVSMGHRPIRNAGAAISGGALQLRTAAVNAQGFDGTGI